MLESCSRWQGLCTECRLRGSVMHPPPLFVKTRPSHSILWSRRAEGSRLIYGAQTELPGWDDSSTWTLPRGKPPASAWLVVACAWQLAIVLEWRQGSQHDPHPGRTRCKVTQDLLATSCASNEWREWDEQYLHDIYLSLTYSQINMAHGLMCHLLQSVGKQKGPAIINIKKYK